jgi:hypothetical protein
MAIKFSQFTVGSSTSDIDYLVGYKNTDNIQIPVGLVGTNTTYAISTAQAGANETITLTGSDSSTDLITITAGSDISLTDDGAGNGFTIASTVVGDTYTLQAGAKAGSSVPLQLDATTGSDSAVSLTEGTGISLTQTSATEITIANTAGVTVVKDQFTGNNSTTAFTLSVTPTAAANLNIFISGVYQNSVDSGGTANYSVSGTTLTFVTPPPTTATNGIEVVITQ